MCGCSWSVSAQPRFCLCEDFDLLGQALEDLGVLSQDPLLMLAAGSVNISNLWMKIHEKPVFLSFVIARIIQNLSISNIRFGNVYAYKTALTKERPSSEMAEMKIEAASGEKENAVWWFIPSS